MTPITDNPAHRATSSVSQPDRLGEIVGEWQLGPLLAESSLASVYHANPRLDHARPDAAARLSANGTFRYTLKLLKRRWQNDPRSVAMFRLEATVGRQLSHPNLVSVLNAAVDEAPYHLIMPHYLGRTLASMLRHGDRPSVASVVWAIRQAASALSALHNAGWLHNDIKPHNVLVAPDGHATLLDLGFVRPIDQAGAVTQRPVLGTLRYIAPEMITSTRRGDSRSDLYSLGIMSYELLTGSAPFDGRSAAALAEQHCSARPAPLEKVAPNIPATLAELVHRLISKEPLRRPQSAQEVVEALARLEIDSLIKRCEEADGKPSQ